MRWDSDHVVTLNDEVKAVAAEVARAGAWDRVHLATDYFDASINRVAAWVIGARATLKAILLALLEPTEMLKKEEASGNHTARLALHGGGQGPARRRRSGTGSASSRACRPARRGWSR